MDEELTSLVQMIDNSVTAAEYLSVDENLCTHDDDVNASIFLPDKTTDDQEESEEEVESEEEMLRIENFQEALEAAGHIRAHLLSVKVKSASLFSSAVQLEKDLIQECSVQHHQGGRQTTLTDFFNCKKVPY